MITYPFSKDPKENIFPNNGHIFKNNQILIEYDLEIIKEYFPDLRYEDSDVIISFLEKINESIVNVSNK